MAFSTGIITVAITATLILSANTTQKKRRFENTGNETIFIGSDASVTVANGFPIKPGEVLSAGDFNGTIYGIVVADTETLQFVEDE